MVSVELCSQNQFDGPDYAVAAAPFPLRSRALMRIPTRSILVGARSCCPCFCMSTECAFQQPRLMSRRISCFPTSKLGGASPLSHLDTLCFRRPVGCWSIGLGHAEYWLHSSPATFARRRLPVPHRQPKSHKPCQMRCPIQRQAFRSLLVAFPEPIRTFHATTPPILAAH